MADPLLTSLCTICHVQPPRYRCPRCKTRTCSLSCVKKHKLWSSCSGERDATAYIPLDKLKTDAGIDHDYNFLTKIERSIERADRIMRDDRHILPPEPSTNIPPKKKTRLNKGQSRGRTTIDNGPRTWDKFMIHRLRDLGIHMSSLAYGMTRAKENMTSYNKRTRKINWQVEWLIFDTEASTAAGGQPQFKRLLHKALDETPLHVAFAEAVEFDRHRHLSDHQRAEEKAQKREEKRQEKRQASGQTAQGQRPNTWQVPPCLMQDHTNGCWDNTPDTRGPHTAQNGHRFFYLKPKTPSREPQRLLQVGDSDTLAGILPGREVVEFPTIYVLPASGVGLGDGYILEEADKRQLLRKRKASTLVDYESDAESLTEATDDKDGRNMEHNTMEESSDDPTSSSGSDTDMSD
ncbi:hypothetical protein GGR50DRAFT_668613 [Xylaria sp. CBS 124048]|nr:hypothetical protein GGR50DRAFT_668613 [Xylaria sp. CBS 124048]